MENINRRLGQGLDDQIDAMAVQLDKMLYQELVIAVDLALIGSISDLIIDVAEEVHNCLDSVQEFSPEFSKS
jgi:hypothetical protein